MFRPYTVLTHRIELATRRPRFNAAGNLNGSDMTIDTLAALLPDVSITQISNIPLQQAAVHSFWRQDLDGPRWVLTDPEGESVEVIAYIDAHYTFDAAYPYKDIVLSAEYLGYHHHPLPNRNMPLYPATGNIETIWTGTSVLIIDDEGFFFWEQNGDSQLNDGGELTINEIYTQGGYVWADEYGELTPVSITTNESDN